MELFKIFEITSYDMHSYASAIIDEEKKKAAINRIHRNFDILAKWCIIFDYHYNYNYLSEEISLSFKCFNFWKKFVMGCLIKYKL